MSAPTSTATATIGSNGPGRNLPVGPGRSRSDTATPCDIFRSGKKPRTSAPRPRWPSSAHRARPQVTNVEIKIPKLSLVVLIGVSGSGKSTFAKKHFLPTEVLSSDHCRGLVSDDENDQSATTDAFDLLRFIGAKRLAAGKLTVIDATNVQEEARKPLVELARQYHALPVAIVFDLPERLCQDRNKHRTDRSFGGHVIRQQS